MDLPDWDEKSLKFITNVGLITSDGPFGPNIMSSEWTHHLSYSPGLIAVCPRPSRTTYENIKETKEFGVSLCAVDQAGMASISGGYHGREYDKIKALKELGFEFIKQRKLNPLW
ncbi:MAG: flavin reductase [Candidatus Aenigmatarchaeota archaeon]